MNQEENISILVNNSDGIVLEGNIIVAAISGTKGIITMADGINITGSEGTLNRSIRIDYIAGCGQGDGFILNGVGNGEGILTGKGRSHLSVHGRRRQHPVTIGRKISTVEVKDERILIDDVRDC